ncbi:FHA domain-containing serine/threonine-protein kinase [Gloeothece verrucosa]|uniref:Serine/threonine protein kinase with FHA domain n=1 Tax=Gloeothece verrucosa (strain PCC 7822) TaxID=497965 RepID=E0UMJ2_GLOV7|nr:FHA domain-containing serine/threonine-protein kinase [Gloeothece verrucosa]ADN18172.1 serine/threonine protein kinase with FHA domain [Gloeothece verrucosa PCC 7822]
MTFNYCLPPGTILGQGKYQIESVLGQGGFGITYQGINLVNLRKVAIKENWPENATRQGTTIIWSNNISPKNRIIQLKKVATEAEYIHRCVHPNIVGVYDWFEENNTAYVVMSLIPGKTLFNIFTEKGIFEQSLVKRYFIQITEALKVIHQANLLHRDIKPENIIITPQDIPILIDFGATKEFIAGQTRQMSATLTPGYAPLEQYSYRTKRYPATDIYALCASMYELLTGQLPTTAAERALSDTLIFPRLLNSKIDPDLEKIIIKGMKLRVEERFQNAEELLKELKKITQTAQLMPKELIQKSEAFFLEPKYYIIGRFTDGELPVDINLEGYLGCETVSRKHGVIYPEEEKWKIKDLGSANGIFIKRVGQARFSSRITQPENLNSGDEIAIGKVKFCFYCC